MVHKQWWCREEVGGATHLGLVWQQLGILLEQSHRAERRHLRLSIQLGQRLVIRILHSMSAYASEFFEVSIRIATGREEELVRINM